MIENTSFEDLFLNACDFIGFTEEELTQKLGEPDQIDTGSNGNRYLVYEDAEVMFEISHSRGILICARAPFRADPKGIREGYYNLLGAKVGDTKDRVYQMWGNPSAVQGVELVYNTKLGTTSSGHNFETRIAIIDDELKDFSGILYIQPQQKAKSGCFIATACYGDYEATEVLVLRNYRDNVLLKNNFGKIAVDIYYYFSPPIAKILDKSESLKAFVRKNILAPIILRIKHNHK